jgi:glutamine synthetase
MSSSDQAAPYELLEARFVDLFGRVKAMAIPLKQPSPDLQQVANDPAVRRGISVDGSSVAGYMQIENSDLHLSPDTSTIFRLPYDPKRAAAYCDVYERGEESHGVRAEMDPRGRLKAVLGEVLTPDQQVQIKPELEFFLLREQEPADSGSYLDVYPSDELTERLNEILVALGEMGIALERVHHECAPGQVEVEIDFAPILTQADRLVSAKAAIRALAHRNGLQANFMPKPAAGIAGSGLHVHFRLLEGERNLLGSEGGRLSPCGRHFVAGLLEHAPALTAVCNPSVNSYKRLVPGHEAPVLICWGYRNRSALVRIPLADSPARVAVEFRSPDATANFYLALAAILAAGMDGVQREAEPPEERSENVYELTPAQLKRLRLRRLPGTLGEALDALEKDEVVLGALGEVVAPRYLQLHRQVCDQYLHGVVTDWERQTYGSY